MYSSFSQSIKQKNPNKQPRPILYAYLKIRSSTSVRVAPILFNSKFREWMAIICSPLSDASPPEARDKLKCNCQGRISETRQIKIKEKPNQSRQVVWCTCKQNQWWKLRKAIISSTDDFSSLAPKQKSSKRHEDNPMNVYFNTIYDTLLYAIFYLAFSIIITIDSSHSAMFKDVFALMGNRGSFPTKY